jgi:hypothetical protein
LGLSVSDIEIPKNLLPSGSADFGEHVSPLMNFLGYSLRRQVFGAGDAYHPRQPEGLYPEPDTGAGGFGRQALAPVLAPKMVSYLWLLAGGRGLEGEPAISDQIACVSADDSPEAEPIVGVAVEGKFLKPSLGLGIRLWRRVELHTLLVAIDAMKPGRSASAISLRRSRGVDRISRISKPT